MSAFSRDSFEAVESVILPLIGSREQDHVCFEYIPVSVGPKQIRFAIPPWVANREALAVGETINFHVALDTGTSLVNRGIIAVADWDYALGSPIYIAELLPTQFQKSSIYLSISSSSSQSVKAAQLRLNCPDDCSPKDLLYLVMKDIVHLKRGVGVYLEHLFPYFSRISEYPRHEFQALKELVLDQIGRSILKKSARLQAIYDKSRKDSRSIHEILDSINFDEFRALVESEVPLEIIRRTFGSSSETPKLRSPLPYLSAIQDLEKRLYSNYNILTTIQAQRTQHTRGQDVLAAM